MRKTILYLALAVLALANTFTSRAQTTLALGDIAFTGYNGLTSDNFSFVILRTGGIAAGTIIKFSDRGWWGMPTNTCGTNSWGTTTTSESEIVWTAAVAIPYGRQVKIQGLTATYAYGAPGTVTGTAFVLSSGGDQIFAYQGTQLGVHTMIAGIQANYGIGITNAGANNWDNTGATSPSGTTSNRPPCLVTGTHAIILTQPAANPDNLDEVDNGRLKASTILSGNPATDRSRVNNIANWEVSDGSEFTLPGALSGLPVDFTWIKALERGGTISVEWGVGTEEQIKDYTIEKSDDGRLYMEVGVVDASGQNSYSYIDKTPSNFKNFYRIRATEISGTTKYSTVAVVNLNKTGKGGISVYPTVIRTNQFNLQITNLPAGSFKMQLHNSTGQLVYSRTINHTGGSATQSINLPASTAKGLYRIRMFTPNENVVTNIIIE